MANLLLNPVGQTSEALFGEDSNITTTQAAFHDPLGIDADTPTADTTLEDFVQEMTPEALTALFSSGQEATQMTGQAVSDATGALGRFGGTAAFDETAALLGALGPEAQQAAIAGIPVSEAQQFGEQRQQKQLARQAAAAGEFGSGATVEGQIGLGSQQAAQRVQGRLGDLAPLTGIEQTTASTISGLQEAGATRQAQILSGLGTQAANLRLGNAAGIVDANTAAGELQALQGLSQANQQSQLLGQFATLLGNRGTTTPTTTTNTSPYVTQSNPLGLTSGQGL